MNSGTITSKVMEIKSCFEYLFTVSSFLFLSSHIYHLVNTKLGSPIFKAMQKIGYEQISNICLLKEAIEDFHLHKNSVVAMSFPLTEYIYHGIGR